MLDVNQYVLDILAQIKELPMDQDPDVFSTAEKALSTAGQTALTALQDLLSNQSIETPKVAAIGNAVIVNNGNAKDRIAIVIAMAMTGAESKQSVKKAILNEPSQLARGNMMSDIIRYVRPDWFTDILYDFATTDKSLLKAEAKGILRTNPFYSVQIAEYFSAKLQAAQSTGERREILQAMAETPSTASISVLADLLSDADLRRDVLPILEAMRYSISKPEQKNILAPSLIQLLDVCEGEELVEALEVAYKTIGSGLDVEYSHLMPIYETCLDLALMPKNTPDSIQQHVLILLGEIYRRSLGQLSQDERDEIISLLNRTYDMTKSEETKTTTAEILTKLGYAPQLRESTCHICGKGMDESPLRECKVCHEPTCTSHLKEYKGCCDSGCLGIHKRSQTRADFY